jgi:hypothetical protein
MKALKSENCNNPSRREFANIAHRHQQHRPLNSPQPSLCVIAWRIASGACDNILQLRRMKISARASN